MKAILISIKPKWVAKILNREKTIEIRKTCPQVFKQLKPYDGCSIDVYIYCTKDKPYLAHATELFTGKYGCISNDEVSYEEHNLNGKVIAKFTLNKVEEIRTNLAMRFFTESSNEKELLEKSCLNSDQLFWYLAPQELKVKCCGYAWHISNLVIFDKPKELSEFRNRKLIGYGMTCNYYSAKPLTKAPQSWQFVESEK